MNTKRMALAAMTMLGGAMAAPAIAHADDNHVSNAHFYAGAGINLYFVDKSDAAEGLPVQFVDQPSPGAFMGRFGYEFNRYVAVEAQVGVGGAKSEFSDGAGTDGKVGVGTPWQVDLVGMYPISDGNTYIMAKAGYASANITRSINGADAPDVKLHGADIGIGAGWRSNNWDFRGEYSMIMGDYNAGVLGFSLARYF
ncbi:MAG: outer membrane beta-barrel protein [Terricaulis sp.]